MGKHPRVPTTTGLTDAEKQSLEALGDDPPTFRQKIVGRVLAALYHHYTDRARGAIAETLEAYVGRSLYGEKLRPADARARGRDAVTAAIATGYVERFLLAEGGRGTVRYRLTPAGLDLAERAARRNDDESARDEPAQAG